TVCFFQAEDGIRDWSVTGVQTCALPISAVNQIPWSPSRYDARLLAAHAERGVALEGYSPLKGTRLRDRTLVEIAAKYGVTPAQRSEERRVGKERRTRGAPGG